MGVFLIVEDILVGFLKVFLISYMTALPLALSNPAKVKPVTILELNEKVSTYHYILSNGLEVFLTPNPKSPNVQVAHWVKAGSLHEKKGTTGIAHLFEHMMFRPLKMGAPSFDQLVDKLGALNNANTRFESTYYHTSVPTKYLKTLLEIEAQRFQNLKVTDGLLDLERGAVWSEYSTKFDSSPILDLWFQIYKSAFKNHPFGWTIIGFREDLEKIKATDCNEYFSKYYRPNNIGLFITGNFNQEPTLQWVIENYQNWQKGPIVDLPSPYNEKTKKIITEGKLPSDNNNIMFGFRTPYQNQKNIQELALLNYILFSSNYSLFKQRLVEDKKIAAAVDDWGLNYDNGMIKALIMALPSTTLPEIEKNIAQIPNDFERLTQTEFDAFKQNFYIEISESLQRNDDLADSLALYWGKYNSIGLLKEISTHPMTLSKEQIKATLDQYFTENNFVYILPPKPEKKNK